MKNYKFIIASVLIAVLLAVSAFATVTLNFNIEDATTDTDAACYKIVVTQTDDAADWRALQTKIKFNYNKIIPIDWYDGSIPSYSGEAAEYPFVFNSFKSGRSSTAELMRPQVPVWTIDGENSEVIVELYWSYLDTYPITASDTMIYEMYFKYADGVTRENLVASDFNVYFVEYGSDAKHYYGNEDDSKNDIVLVNNVVPAAAKITVPVAAGDIVYLQDGTYATAAEAGDYQVLNDVGYVAVNTGKTSQKTYYIDGATATEVHINGAVGSDDLSLRAIDAYDVDENNKNRSGLRFKLLHNPNTREVGKGENPVAEERDVVTEVGFLMTAKTAKVVAALGENPVLTKDHVSGYVKTGKAFSTETGENKAFNMDNDELWIISGVFYGVPLTTANVQTEIISRPYYVVDGKVIYGEQTVSTLFDTAKSIKNSDDYNGLSQYAKDYIDEIIGLVETNITEDEIIIDITDLYVGL